MVSVRNEGRIACGGSHTDGRQVSCRPLFYVLSLPLWPRWFFSRLNARYTFQKASYLSVFFPFLFIHHESLSPRCRSVAACYLDIHNCSQNHIDPMEDPTTLQETRDKRPRLPTHIREHGWDRPFVCGGAVKINIFWTWYSPFCGSTLPPVVIRLWKREDFHVVVWDDSGVGNIGAGVDKGGSHQFNWLLWQDWVQPFS